MRIGYSWPLASRRRMWVSMGPLGWLLFGWLYVTGWAVILLAALAVLLGRAIVWVFTLRWHWSA